MKAGFNPTEASELFAKLSPGGLGNGCAFAEAMKQVKQPLAERRESRAAGGILKKESSQDNSSTH